MLKQIRFHGRAGEGMVTAAELLAEAAGLEGKFSQAFPVFGSEKRGPPVMSYCKISDSKITTYEQIHEPDIVVVANESIMNSVDVCSGLKAGGLVFVNTRKKPGELKVKRGVRVFTVDGTSIALKNYGKLIVNTVMLGPLLKKTGIVSLSSMENAIRQHFEPEFVEVNLKVVKEAYGKA